MQKLTKGQLRAIHAKNYRKSSMHSSAIDRNHPTKPTGIELTRYANLMKRRYEDKVQRKVRIEAHVGYENFSPKVGFGVEYESQK